MLETVVALLLLLALAFQLVHLVLLAGARLESEIVAEGGSLQPVSIVICARNESAQLAQRLPGILAQQYHTNGLPAFEVLVADDASTDETAAVTAHLQQKFPQLHYLSISPAEKLFPAKKGALSMAVKAAQYEVLLLTDADCRPAGPHWISGMMAKLTAGKELVAGYAPYEKTGGFLNAFIRCEALLSFLHISALHSRGIVYAATGRNLLVRKKTFQEAAVQPLWTKTLSGDDDMLVRIAATAQNFAVQSVPESAMHSPAKATLQEYIAQKQRHMSTGKYYRLGVKTLFFLLNGSQFLFWAVLPFALGVALAPCFVGTGSATSGLLLMALGFALLRILAFALLLFKAARRQGEQLPFFFFPLFDAGTAVHSLFFAPYIFWKNKTTWK